MYTDKKKKLLDTKGLPKRRQAVHLELKFCATATKELGADACQNGQLSAT